MDDLGTPTAKAGGIIALQGTGVLQLPGWSLTLSKHTPTARLR